MTTPVVLDTCAVVALADGEPMRPEALHAIRQAQALGQALVPSVVAGEIAQKAWVGKLTLRDDVSPRRYVQAFMAGGGMVEIQVSISAALAAYELPEPFHKDPADRLIVALARLARAPVVTSDGRILDYAALGHVRAIAC